MQSAVIFSGSWFGIFFVLYILLVLFTAGLIGISLIIKHKKTASNKKKAANELRNGADIQPGAVIKDSTDENGNQVFEYSNPGGTGCGGIVVE